MNNSLRLGSMAALAAALALSGCAQVSAAGADLPAPAASVQLSASARNGLFSSIPGSLTVQGAALKQRAMTVPAPAILHTGTNGQTVTYTFTPAAGEFGNGDVLTVTWSADAVTLLGSHYAIQQAATYSFHGRVGK